MIVIPFMIPDRKLSTKCMNKVMIQRARLVDKRNEALKKRDGKKWLSLSKRIDNLTKKLIIGSGGK